MLKDIQSIFFIGIGGINMSSLAHISSLRGLKVGGSDKTKTALTEKLERSGIEIFYEHDKNNIKDYEAVVYTVAISPENPEYVEAQNRGIPCISRADYLGYLMMGYKRRIGISGMHGKSTTTSMCAEVFMKADADPTVCSGAELQSMDGAYRIGESENFIFESCEYMDSFLDFNPSIAVVLNIEMDHVDYFKSMDQIVKSYSKFVNITGYDGYAIINADNMYSDEVVKDYPGCVVKFGLSSKKADFYAINIRYDNGFPEFDIMHKDEFFTHVKLSVPGEHNIYNALATVAVGYVSGLDAEKISQGLSNFRGAKRRMELKGTLNGAKIFDDYGHHPTEVKATLDGLKKISSERLFCVFQSHTYSRTAALLDDFANSFESADRVFVADIYPARETDNLGMSGELLAERIGNKAEYIKGFENIANEISKEVFEGDNVIVMGAGDIYKVFDYINFDK